ncbi:hypothetical protein BB559_003370 [Furculomyces boomerangus]|uniref:Uncharacterized protein n=2 Tax=Harpellales TaxID=61421 RepID=A0A2T9YLV0_9FUNG|nr:hypothetical protein BB559_003370 [Furculomyces boomerangus]PWA00429.1 hypothetical protein BB558_003525 [Smittium angustum]
MEFQQILSKIGINLSDTKVEINQETIFSKENLRKIIENIDRSDFIDGFSTYISNEECLRKTLLPMTRTNQNTSINSFAEKNEESLVRLLLGIDQIQTKLIENILELLPEYAESSERSNGISSLIIENLKWLDYISNPKILSEKYLEVLEIVPEIVQKEMLAAISDIISDSEHIFVSKKLVELIDQTPQLLVSILDALGGLRNSNEIERSVQNTALEMLVSSKSLDLPAILGYLFQSAIELPETAENVIS